jgi:hypothetical protein
MPGVRLLNRVFGCGHSSCISYLGHRICTSECSGLTLTDDQKRNPLRFQIAKGLFNASTVQRFRATNWHGKFIYFMHDDLCTTAYSSPGDIAQYLFD